MKSNIRLCLATIGLFFWSQSYSQELEPTQIFNRNGNSIVLIITYDQTGEPVAQGSGVVVYKSMVATNCHVVLKSTLIGVMQKGEVRLANVIAAYPDSDLCVLLTDGRIGEPSRLASGMPQAGARVYALGHPRGLDLTISEGLVSGNRSTPKATFIQFSAAVSPGSSGGGLFDSKGELVGVTTSTLRESQNINFAAPVDLIAVEVNRAAKLSAANSGAKQVARDSATQAIASVAPVVLEFDDTNQRVAYLQWLARQSKRLNRSQSDLASERELLKTVWFESKRAGIQPELVLALIQTLSGYRKFSVSSDGARGFMHVLPKWTKILGAGDPSVLFHLQTNLRFGCVIFRHFADSGDGSMNSTVRKYLVEGSGVKLDKPSLDSLVRAVLAAKAAIDM
jgi:hypothetical protein